MKKVKFDKYLTWPFSGSKGPGMWVKGDFNNYLTEVQIGVDLTKKPPVFCRRLFSGKPLGFNFLSGRPGVRQVGASREGLAKMSRFG